MNLRTFAAICMFTMTFIGGYFTLAILSILS